jgi:hypothetical protein
MNEQGSRLSIAVTSKLRGITSRQCRRLYIDRNWFELRMFHNAQCVLQNGSLHGEYDHFTHGLIALPNVGGFQIAQLCLIQTKWNASSSFLSHEPIELWARLLRNPQTLQKNLPLRQAAHRVFAAKLALG